MKANENILIVRFIQAHIQTDRQTHIHKVNIDTVSYRVYGPAKWVIYDDVTMFVLRKFVHVFNYIFMIYVIQWKKDTEKTETTRSSDRAKCMWVRWVFISFHFFNITIVICICILKICFSTAGNNVLMRLIRWYDYLAELNIIIYI